jgi:hypothetical protein
VPLTELEVMGLGGELVAMHGEGENTLALHAPA